MTTTPTHWRQERRAIGRALVIAGVFLQASIVIRVLTPTRLDPEEAQRLVGVLIGMVLALQASVTPKFLPPLRPAGCDPRAEQGLRRFMGWSLTLGGVGYSFVWMVAPIESAKGLGISVMGASLLVAIFRFTRALASRGQRPRPMRS